MVPPFNAEARVTNPVGGFDDPWRGTGNENVLPVHGRTERGVPTDWAVHLDPARHQAAAAAVVEPRRPAADRQRHGRVGHLHRARYSDRLWNVRSLNPGVYIPGSCTLQTATGPQFFPGLLGQHEPRSAPRADDGRLRGRQVSGRRRRAHRARHAEYQRNAAERAAPTGQWFQRQRQLHAVASAMAIRRRADHAQRQLRVT